MLVIRRKINGSELTGFQTYSDKDFYEECADWARLQSLFSEVYGDLIIEVREIVGSCLRKSAIVHNGQITHRKIV